MKKYALFAFEDHGASGGWGDLEGLFATVEAAMTWTSQLYPGFEYHIVDLTTGKIIKEGKATH
jgi:hypothetical protein